MNGFEAGLIGAYLAFYGAGVVLRTPRALGIYALSAGALMGVGVGWALSHRSRLAGHGHFEAITDAIQTVLFALSCFIAFLFLLWRVQRDSRRGTGKAVLGGALSPILAVTLTLILFSPILEFPWS